MGNNILFYQYLYYSKRYYIIILISNYLWCSIALILALHYITLSFIKPILYLNKFKLAFFKSFQFSLVIPVHGKIMGTHP